MKTVKIQVKTNQLDMVVKSTLSDIGYNRLKMDEYHRGTDTILYLVRELLNDINSAHVIIKEEEEC